MITVFFSTTLNCIDQGQRKWRVGFNQSCEFAGTSEDEIKAQELRMYAKECLYTLTLNCRLSNEGTIGGEGQWRGSRFWWG